jgi:polyisoprenoid-binding protein YceI
MKNWMLVGIGGLALAATGLATAQMPTEKPGAPDPSRISGGTYSSDPNHTLVGWRVDHLGYTDYFGLFGDVTGTLALDPANPAAAKVDVIIPVNPLVASAGLREHLLRPGKDGKAPDFFGPEPKPARFVSTKVTPGADGTSAYILGNLTLNGRTNPVGIQARFNGAGTMMGTETVGFQGRALIRRSAFGIATGIPFVSDEVELDISAAFEKKGAGDPQTPPPAPAVQACRADKAQPWFGKKATAKVRAAVQASTNAKAVRWLYPDSVVTMDYREDRLNVTMDKGTDVIRSARCG